jgi:hypothetical protein
MFSGESNPAVVVIFHAAVPPAGLIEVANAALPLSADSEATHSFVPGAQPIAAMSKTFWGVLSFTVFQVDPLPAGLVDTRTSGSSTDATHKLLEAQAIPVNSSSNGNAGVLRVHVGCADVGLVETSIRSGSAITHRAADGQAISCSRAPPSTPEATLRALPRVVMMVPFSPTDRHVVAVGHATLCRTLGVDSGGL